MCAFLMTCVTPSHSVDAKKVFLGFAKKIIEKEREKLHEDGLDNPFLKDFCLIATDTMTSATYPNKDFLSDAIISDLDQKIKLNINYNDKIISEMNELKEYFEIFFLQNNLNHLPINELSIKKILKEIKEEKYQDFDLYKKLFQIFVDTNYHDVKKMKNSKLFDYKDFLKELESNITLYNEIEKEIKNFSLIKEKKYNKEIKEIVESLMKDETLMQKVQNFQFLIDIEQSKDDIYPEVKKFLEKQTEEEIYLSMDSSKNIRFIINNIKDKPEYQNALAIFHDKKKFYDFSIKYLTDGENEELKKDLREDLEETVGLFFTSLIEVINNPEENFEH